jgi:3-hydroxyisobutyrate dehydrogenase
MNRRERVGVIGTGIMGEPMARNLLTAGFSVEAFTRTPAKAKELLSLGATWRASPSDLARHCDVVISMVSDSPDVEAVYLGRSGVVEGLSKGQLCIDMSTVAPETVLSVAAQVERRGGRFLDAPVSGGKNGAEAGKLSIMVGGAAADVQRAQPIFDALGKLTVHCGPVGNGQLTKLCNQILGAVNLLALSETIAFAKRAGLDLNTMHKALSAGAATSWMLENLGPRMIARDFAPMFMIDLQQKDLRIALAAARENAVSLPGTGLVHQLFASNQAHGEGRDGTQALLKTLERLSGIG